MLWALENGLRQAERWLFQVDSCKLIFVRNQPACFCHCSFTERIPSSKGEGEGEGVALTADVNFHLIP
jgi:hypothetical protein